MAQSIFEDNFYCAASKPGQPVKVAEPFWHQPAASGVVVAMPALPLESAQNHLLLLIFNGLKMQASVLSLFLVKLGVPPFFIISLQIGVSSVLLQEEQLVVQ